MAATRENVLAAIVQYVEDHKRRAPAKDIATLVGDSIPNVQAIIKQLVSDGSINSSRGRNGGALPPGVVLPQREKSTASKVAKEAASIADDDATVADQFAMLMEQLGKNEESASEQSVAV